MGVAYRIHYMLPVGRNGETMTTTSPAPRIDEPVPLALANTIWVDRHGVHDVLADRDYMENWVRVIGKRLELTPAINPSQRLSADAVTRLTDLRDAIRRLAADATKDPRTLGLSPVPTVAAAVSLINEISATSSVWPELSLGRRRLTRRDAWSGKSFPDGLITVIARQTVDLATSPQWKQLRPCTAPACAYYFVKEHRREWCSALCGNRARVARHAQRQRGR
jgi:predicted RNA-binding Zn ribbon-like protein